MNLATGLLMNDSVNLQPSDSLQSMDHSVQVIPDTQENTILASHRFNKTSVVNQPDDQLEKNLRSNSFEASQEDEVEDDNKENDEYQDTVEDEDEEENKNQLNSETLFLTNPKTPNTSHSQPKHKRKNPVNTV